MQMSSPVILEDQVERGVPSPASQAGLGMMALCPCNNLRIYAKAFMHGPVVDNYCTKPLTPVGAHQSQNSLMKLHVNWTREPC